MAVTFVGIDPSGLAELTSVLGRQADTIESVASRATDPLYRFGRERTADRVGTRLTSTVRYLRTSAEDFQWRIDAVLTDATSFWARPITFSISRAVLATALPVGAGPPSERVSLAQPMLHSLTRKTPEQVAVYFASQDRETINLLAAAFPGSIGAMDGAPPWARYAANDLLIAGRIALLQRQVARSKRLLANSDMAWFMNEFIEIGMEEAVREIAELELWLEQDRQILLFDPRGDGRVVEVFGDLERAGNVGIVVPGIKNDQHNFSQGDGGFRAGARNVYGRSQELGIDDVATIAWLGYDTPDGADAVLRAAATAGHGRLVDFVAGMDALPGNRHITVIGHSYGSLVTGMAAADGLAADEVVFIGSPGTGLDHAQGAKLKPGGVVWAGLAGGDPIGAGLDISEYLSPSQRFEQFVRRLVEGFDSDHVVKELHHGTNPVHQEFGALAIHTDGSRGHSEYFKKDTVTLDNLLYIIAAMDARVSVEIADIVDGAPGPIGQPDVPTVTVTA